jgi:hypothetical protein
MTWHGEEGGRKGATSRCVGETLVFNSKRENAPLDKSGVVSPLLLNEDYEDGSEAAGFEAKERTAILTPMMGWKVVRERVFAGDERNVCIRSGDLGHEDLS